MCRNTAKGFKNAAEMFEVVSVFGQVAEREAQMRIYSKAKAMDILAALKEGRQPTPVCELYEGWRGCIGGSRT